MSEMNEPTEEGVPTICLESELRLNPGGRLLTKSWSNGRFEFRSIVTA